MSQRTDRVESLIRQTVATALLEELGQAVARTTVTAVDVSPDLKHGTVWLGVLGTDQERQAVINEVKAKRSQLQSRVVAVMTTKYVPRLQFKLDTGSDYAERINQVIREL